jgi:hypothetical protein
MLQLFEKFQKPKQKFPRFVRSALNVHVVVLLGKLFLKSYSYILKVDISTLQGKFIHAQTKQGSYKRYLLNIRQQDKNKNS